MENKSITFVRCLKCGKILECTRHDTEVLIAHIISDHPDVQIVPSDSKTEMSNTKNKGNTFEMENLKTKFNQNSLSNIVGDNQANKISKPANDNDEDTLIRCMCNDDLNNKDITLNLSDKPIEADDVINIEKNITHQANDKGSNIQKDSMHQDNIKVPKPFSEKMAANDKVRSYLADMYPDGKQNESSAGNSSASVLYTKRIKLKTPSATTSAESPHSPQNNNTSRYINTIKNWNPRCGTIFCPRCSCNRAPMTKSRIEQIMENQFYACCFFSCWPFCFFPCLIDEHETESLHCPNCKALLGVYNRKLQCIKPNMDFYNCKDAHKRQIRFEENMTSSTETSSVHRRRKSNRKNLPSIVIDGKHLHPDMVARLHSFQKYGDLAGIDLDSVVNDDNQSETSPHDDSIEDNCSNRKPKTSGRRKYFD